MEIPNKLIEYDMSRLFRSSIWLKFRVVLYTKLIPKQRKLKYKCTPYLCPIVIPSRKYTELLSEVSLMEVFYGMIDSSSFPPTPSPQQSAPFKTGQNQGHLHAINCVKKLKRAFIS